MAAIVTVYELGRDGDGSGQSQEYTREFEVRMSDGTGTVAQAAGAVGVTILDPHPENLFALAYRARAQQDKTNPQFWQVSINYKTFGRTYADEERMTEPNPINRRPEVSISSWSMRVPVPFDSEGALIVNSAGTVPEPRLEADVELPAYHIKANVYPLPDWIDTYKNKYGRSINRASFRVQFQNGQYKTIKPGCARLSGVSSSTLKTENGQQFFEVSFTLLQKDPPPLDTSQDGWAFDMADIGKMEKAPVVDPEVGIACELRPIMMQDGQQVSEPWLLTGNGRAAKKSSGDWASSTAYKKADDTASPPTYGDVVTKDGIDYYCTADSTGNTPPNDDYWRPLPHVIYWDYLKRDDFIKLPGCSALS